MMLYTSPELAAQCLLFTAPPVLSLFLLGNIVKTNNMIAKEKIARTSAFAEERFSNIRTVRVCNMEDSDQTTYRNLVQDLMNFLIRLSKLETAQFFVNALYMNSIIVWILYSGGRMVSLGDLTVGGLAMFSLYLVVLSTGLTGLGANYSALMHGLASSNRVWEVLEHTPRIETSAGIIPKVTIKLLPLLGKLETPLIICLY